jgi:uncharacterized membrane protein
MDGECVAERSEGLKRTKKDLQQRRMTAAMGYLVTPMVPVVVLLGDTQRDPYQRRHAVQALLWSGPFVLLLIVAVGLLIALSDNFVVALCLSPIVVALPFVPGAIWARRVFLGGDVTIPLVSRFAPARNHEDAQG